ncbi:MAG TPA: hypothetical protein VI968_00025 [archaeon]|nr:hypothetical protein [archaeon]
MKYQILLALLFVFSTVYAIPNVDTVDVDFSIRNDMTIFETITVVFSEALNSTISYKPESNILELSVTSGGSPLPFEYVKSGDVYIIKISAQGKSEITISFVSKSLVFSNNNVFQFLADMNFDVPVKKMTAELSFPEGYGLYEESFTPIGGILKTNGKNIFIAWDLDGTNSAVFSAKFFELNRQLNAEIFVVIVIAAAAIAAIFYYRKKTKKEFLTGFREDEKKVIAYMTQHKTSYQNVIEKEFHFSRAKMTRIAKHLAAEGVLEKKKYGRTNRLTWKKR